MSPRRKVPTPRRAPRTPAEIDRRIDALERRAEALARELAALTLPAPKPLPGSPEGQLDAAAPVDLSEIVRSLGFDVRLAAPAGFIREHAAELHALIRLIGLNAGVFVVGTQRVELPGLTFSVTREADGRLVVTDPPPRALRSRSHD